MLLKYRSEYQPFVGKSMTQQAYAIQFSTGGDEWFDLEDEFTEDVAKALVSTLESLKLENFEDLRPEWTKNN